MAKKLLQQRLRNPSLGLNAESANIAHALTVAQEMGDEGKPKNYSEAISSYKSTKWIAAMQKEVESLRINKT